MTQAITQRDQAIIIIDRAEKRPQPILFAHYQKNHFFGYDVRFFRVKDDEDATRCVLSNVSQETLSFNSYIVICNGVTQTTEQLARDFFHHLSNVKKRKVSDEASTPPKKQKVIPRLGLTSCGQLIVKYVTSALETGRWNGYFTRSVSNKHIHRDYHSWCLEMRSKGAEIDPPVDIRPFMKTLRGMLPDIRTKATGRSQIPAADKCKELWASTKTAIQKTAHIPAGHSVQRYVLSTDREIVFKGTIDFSSLYTDYRKWCLNEGYASRKNEDRFIVHLSFYETCQIFWRTKCVTFGKIIDDQKRPLISPSVPKIPQEPAYKPFPKKQKKRTVYSAMTQPSKNVVHYVATALGSNRWHSCFSKKIASATIHDDYCAWRQEISLIDKEISCNPFIRTLHRLLPNIRGDRSSYQHFPTEEECLAQWQLTLRELEKPKNPYKRKER